MRHVAAMMTGAVNIAEKGSEFENAKPLLEAKYQHRDELFPVREGESVILRFKPTKAVTRDYGLGELRKPHQGRPVSTVTASPKPFPVSKGEERKVNKPVHILGIAGSLRRGSYNRAALQAAKKLLPEDATLEIFELRGIPVFSEDDEHTLPAKVAQLKARIRAADAILIVTPEYNYSIPGVLKNAIDWASRPYGDSAWSEKPVAIMGASVGRTGTARAQYHLRQVFVSLNLFPVNQPEVMIGNAAEHFDAWGNLTNETTKQLIRQLLRNLVDWTRRLGESEETLKQAS